ncbi:MAG: acetate--CoA ligase family protein [Bacillota bacterium]|nr:acetate--CoA ligase family protein [Bacillota bacterium]
MTSSPLQQILYPRSIATVGAGNNPMKMGAIQALSIVKDGFPGKFYPVHPTEKEIFGYKAYPTALDLPEAPDLVMFVLPAQLVVQLLDDFGRIGTRRAIIITAGFRETGEEGHKLEERLIEVAERHGIRFLGPNCMGIINTEINLNVTVMPLAAMPGSLGMASQSGTYITQTLPYLQRRGIRFSKAISVGNESDLNIIDALEFLGSDQQTKAIALYIEGIRDGSRFLEVARKITPQKPIIAQYVGGSKAGARAGSSHTGAMAGPDYLYDGLFRQAGILRVDSVEELYNQGWVLATQTPLKGSRIAVLTNSGGPGTAISHTCNAGGLDIPQFSEGLQEKIRELIPPYGAAGNPVDLTFHLDAEVLSNRLPELLMGSGEIDGMIAHGLMSSGFLRAVFPHIKELLGFEDEEQFISQFSRDLTGPVSLPKKYGIPLILSSFFGREDNYTTAYQDNDIPVFDAPEKAARGMLALHRYNLVKRRSPFQPAEIPSKSEQVEEIIKNGLEHGEFTLNEYCSKKILAAYGVPISREMLTFNEEEAVASAIIIDFPVVLKACSSEYVHKTGKGLIQLNLNSVDEVRNAFRSIIKAAGKDIPVLVSKMVKGEREVMAGMVRHPGFGPCVLFGLGGIFTEALHDNTFRLAPLSRDEAAEMIGDIRSAEILNNYRGLPEVDRALLGAILQAIGSIAILHPDIAEIDINPIMISGNQPVAVDALVVLEK